MSQTQGIKSLIFILMLVVGPFNSVLPQLKYSNELKCMILGILCTSKMK